MIWQVLYAIAVPLAGYSDNSGVRAAAVPALPGTGRVPSPAQVVMVVHHNVEAAENLLVAVIFVVYHRRLTQKLYGAPCAYALPVWALHTTYANAHASRDRGVGTPIRAGSRARARCRSCP